MACADGLLLLSPPAGTVMVDTDRLIGATYDVQVMLHGNTGYEAYLQIRDATNTTSLMSHVISCVMSYAEMRFDADLLMNQRVRLVLKTDLSGDASAEVEAAIFFREKGVAYALNYDPA